LIITDNLGDISDIVLPKEVDLLLPYADELLEPILKKEKTREVKGGGKK